MALGNPCGRVPTHRLRNSGLASFLSTGLASFLGISALGPLGLLPLPGCISPLSLCLISCLLDLGIYLVNFVLKQIYLPNFHYLCQRKRNDTPRKLKQKNISFIEIKVLQNLKSQRIESQKKSAVAQI